MGRLPGEAPGEAALGGAPPELYDSSTKVNTQTAIFPRGGRGSFWALPGVSPELYDSNTKVNTQSAISPCGLLWPPGAFGGLLWVHW